MRPVKVPDAARLFASFARPAVGDRGGDWFYRLTSAFAHGRSWGRMLGNRTEVMSKTRGGALTQVTADHRATLLVTRSALA